MPDELATPEMLKDQVDFLNQQAAEYIALADRLERLRLHYSTDTRLEAEVLLAEARELLPHVNSVKVKYEDLVAKREHILEHFARLKGKAEAAEAERNR